LDEGAENAFQNYLVFASDGGVQGHCEVERDEVLEFVV